MPTNLLHHDPKTGSPFRIRVRTFGDKIIEIKAESCTASGDAEKWYQDMVEVAWRAVTKGEGLELDAKVQKLLVGFLNNGLP